MLTLRKIFQITQASCLLIMILLVHKLLEADQDNLQQFDEGQFAELMMQRVTRLNDQCSKRNVSKPNIKTGENLYVLYGRQLVWCPVFKAASTNWMYNLLPLAGLQEQDIDSIR